MGSTADMSRPCRAGGLSPLGGCSAGAGGLVTLGPEPFSSGAFSSAGVGFSPGDPDATAWWLDPADAPYLSAVAGTTARRPLDYGYRDGPDLAEDLRGLVRTLGRQDLDVLVLDQTRPDAGLPVVKVLVPGLRSMWARFAPGRLFDAPVRMGRPASPTPYECLNPNPKFLR